MDTIIDPDVVKKWLKDNHTTYESIREMGLIDAFNNEVGFEVFNPICFDEGAAYADFLITTTALYGHSWSFSVYEIGSWQSFDRNNLFDVPCDLEIYINGFIKWDGCSHFWFGDEDGYIHICGADEFEKHNKLMTYVYNEANEMIQTFDQSELLT